MVAAELRGKQRLRETEPLPKVTQQGGVAGLAYSSASENAAFLQGEAEPTTARDGCAPSAGVPDPKGDPQAGPAESQRAPLRTAHDRPASHRPPRLLRLAARAAEV